MKSARGFTLIEILIALTIFAILATITSTSLYYAFNSRNRVNAQAERLNALQQAISLMQQDTAQTIARSIRGNDMHLFPAFIGQEQYFEFTRDGVVNPDSYEKRSTLMRIAYTCVEGKFIRRTWNSIDTVERNNHEDKVLLNNITKCHFNYLSDTLQILSDWREQAVTQDQRAQLFPKAVQINLTLKKWGEINLLFIIPEALYAPD